MDAQSPNKLLSALPAADYRRLLRSLQTVHLKDNETLASCGDARVYFPGTGACSVGSLMKDGRVIEIAGVGNEGIVGLSLLAGDTPTFRQVSDGSSQFMELRAFEREIERGGALRPLIDRYSRLFLEAVMRLALCNRLHTLQERCCRWLLMSHGRIGRERFELTQEFLARALGAKRQELAAVMRALSNLGLLRHDERTVTVLDADGLERLACDCYDIMKKQLKSEPARHVEPKRPAKILPLRPDLRCSRCGSSVNLPHKTEYECIRSIDAEMTVLIHRAHNLHQQRGQLVQQRLRMLRAYLEKPHPLSAD